MFYSEKQAGGNDGDYQEDELDISAISSPWLHFAKMSFLIFIWIISCVSKISFLIKTEKRLDK